MPLEPVFETITASGKKTEVYDHIKVECKTEILTEDVKRVLNVCVFPSLTHCDAEDGKINYTGKATFYICYEDSDGTIRKCEYGNEFSGTVANKEIISCRALTDLNVEKTETDASGIKLTVSAIISVKAEIKRQEEASALVGGENLICKADEISVKKGFGVKEGVYPVEEQFELPYAVEEVLFHRAEPVVTSVQCGVGCIIVDGEVRLSAILLQKNQKKDIIKENKTLPFRIEVEYEDAMPTLTAVSKAVLKSFKTDIAVDEDGGKSSVTANVLITFYSETFSTETVNLATDVFSLTDNTETERGELCSVEALDVRTCSFKISSSYTLDEACKTAKLKAVAGEHADIMEITQTDSGLTVTGTLSATAYLLNDELRLITRKIEIPFDASCDVAVEPECTLEAKAVADCVSAKLTASDLELDVELTATFYPTKERQFKYIKGVKSTGEKQQNDCAISVYIPLEGENLWSLSKRLNVSPETLSQTNPDLKFPLSGTERIVVYRQK